MQSGLCASKGTRRASIGGCVGYLLVVPPYGIGSSLVAVISAFAGVPMLALQHVIPYAYTPVVLIALAGMLVVVGALMDPETRDVELGTSELDMHVAAPAMGD